MATNKVTSGDYVISVGPYTGNTWSGTMTINGNLAIVGNVTYVADLAVNDAFIIVAANNDGTVNQMGLVAQKTANTFAGLRYNDVTSEWEISSTVYANGAPVGDSYLAISTGNATVAGSNTWIQFNDSGNFGAAANLTFDQDNSQLVLQGSEVLGNIGATPSATSNSVTLYNKAEGLGGTGLYVKSTTVDDETVSYIKARLYAIIY